MLGNVALYEQRAQFGIESAGDQDLGQLDRLVTHLARSLGDREGVQIDDAVEGIGGTLVLDPVLDGSQQVSEMEITSGLDAGEDAGHGQ